jgi:hypothetical protein
MQDHHQETKLYPAWRQLEEDLMARGLKDGETIPMRYLRDALGLSGLNSEDLSASEALRQQALFNFAMGDLKRSLLENHRIMLRLVEGVGYMVVPPAKQAPIAARARGAEIANAIAAAERETRQVRHELLTDEERRQATNLHARFASLALMTRERLKGPSPYMPAADSSKEKSRSAT